MIANFVLRTSPGKSLNPINRGTVSGGLLLTARFCLVAILMDGKLYGTAWDGGAGGASGQGAIYQLKLDGVATLEARLRLRQRLLVVSAVTRTARVK